MFSRGIVTTALGLGLAVVGLAQTQTGDLDSPIMVKRATVAIMYPEGEGTSIDMVGTTLGPRVSGKAEVKRAAGRTRIKLEIANLEHPQGLGSYYTTYVLWAVAPEGQADNLGELPVTGADKREIEFTTPYQTFGLILTAEPHGLVKLPGPAIVAENILRKNTKGGVAASRIDYRGDPGSLYAASSTVPADFSTPLLVLGARRAVDIARRAGAERFAEAELRQAEIRLAALEQIWPRERDKEKRFSGEAHEVTRLAEQARAVADEQRQRAHLAAERRVAQRTIEDAQSEADRARGDAERARGEAASYRDALTRSEQELREARRHVDEAKTEADRAKANEELARIQAEHSRLQAERAVQERDSAQQRLFVSLSEILETRREARGLIVNLSDVLFDFNQSTLKPGAKEKLAKLAGILLAYPGSYRIEIEGHTDAVGSEEYNLKLSEARAASVRDYITQAGIVSDRIVAARGLGKTRPVATNDTPEGRQMNRRVEIVIEDHVISQQ
jgi:outer membrane protein OmpA-like peptidoglycan-associated protein